MRALIGPSVLLYLDTSRKVLSQKGVVSVENYFQNFYGGGGPYTHGRLSPLDPPGGPSPNTIVVRRGRTLFATAIRAAVCHLVPDHRIDP